MVITCDLNPRALCISNSCHATIVPYTLQWEVAIAMVTESVTSMQKSGISKTPNVIEVATAVLAAVTVSH